MKTRTTIKFKQSAWAVVLAVISTYSIPGVHAQLYWDSNGATPGAGATPTGSWGVNAFWSTDSAGTIATGAYTPGSAVVFTAGTDAVNSYTVGLTGTQSASGITFQSPGAVTVSGGTSLQIGSGGVTATTNVTISSPTFITANQTWSVASGKTWLQGGAITGGVPLIINKTGSGTLRLNVGSSSAAFAGFAVSEGTLQVSATNALPFGAGTSTTVSNGATLLNSSGSTTLDFLFLNGGTVTTSGTGIFHLRGNSSTANTAVTVAGGANTSTMSGNYVLTQTTATKFDVSAGATNGIDLDVTGTIGVFGSVNAMNKLGAGVMRLTGSNTYTGGTTVTAGTLLVSNTAGSGLGTGNATVNGGTLGGSGSFTGSVTVNSGGTLAPGASIQSLASGAATLNTGSTFAYEVDSGVLPSVGADLQVVNGTLSLTGTVELTLNNLSVGTFANNTKFTLINYNGTWNSGLFTYNSSILNDGDTFSFNGQTWEIDYNATVGGVNFSGEYLPSSNFVNMTAVPEPSAWILAAFGLTTAVVFRRRRVA